MFSFFGVFICLLTRLLKDLWMNFCEIFVRVGKENKQNLVNFGVTCMHI